MNTNITEKYSIAPFFNAFRKTLKQKIGSNTQPLILVQGGFGKHNTGDDTLLLVAIREIKTVYPEARIYALCHNPAFLQEDYGIKGIKFKSFKTLKYLLKTDALIVPAGGLVNNIDYNSTLRSLINPRGKFVLIALLLTILRRKCTVVFGVGIHEIPDFIVKYLLKITIPHVNLLCVRDKYTVSVVKELGCKNFFFAHDPVISYKRTHFYNWNEYKNSKHIPFEKFIVLNFRLVKNSGQSVNAIKQLAEFIHYVNENFPEYGILLMPFSIHPTFELENDVIAFKELLSYVKKKYTVKNCHLIDQYMTADDVKIIAEHASMLILTRHHAPIITYECHVPTVIISYNIKCREFGELGEYKYIIDYDKLDYLQLEEITESILQK